jgi:hypothetical protein
LARKPSRAVTAGAPDDFDDRDAERPPKLPSRQKDKLTATA